MVQLALKTLKHALGDLRPHLEEILRSVSLLPLHGEHRVFVEQLLEYIVKVGRDVPEHDVEQAVLAFGSREVKEAYVTVADQLIARGKAEGKSEGELHGKQETLLRQLTQKFGAVSDKDKSKITDTKDPDKLDQALGLILNTETIEEILRPLD